MHGCTLRENVPSYSPLLSSSRATKSSRRPSVARAVPYSLPNPGILKSCAVGCIQKSLCLFQKGGFCPLGFQGLPASTAGAAELRGPGRNFIPGLGGLCAAAFSPLRSYAQNGIVLGCYSGCCRGIFLVFQLRCLSLSGVVAVAYI